MAGAHACVLWAGPANTVRHQTAAFQLENISNLKDWIYSSLFLSAPYHKIESQKIENKKIESKRSKIHLIENHLIKRHLIENH
jgi:HD-GYP domain-containing protein (c-di-GMP phosphodiesterase class II)